MKAEYNTLVLTVDKENFYIGLVTIHYYPPWWPNWFDHGAPISVDALGCGMSVVRGLTGTSRKVSWGTAVTKGFLTESAYFSSCISHSTAS